MYPRAEAWILFTFRGDDGAPGDTDGDDDDDVTDDDVDAPEEEEEEADLGESEIGLGRWTDRGLVVGPDKGAGGTKLSRRAGDAGA
jgi:hypothetical protein